MEGRPLVSVIIPVYNRQKYIKEAIDSVLSQTYKNHEIIVIDDGSTDSTKNFLEPYIKKKQIKYIYQNNKGVSSARNKGIQNSKGELIAFLDSDDLWLPEKLEVQVKLFKDKEVSLVYSPIMNFDVVSKKRFVYPPALSQGYIFKDILMQNLIGTSSVIVRRKALDSVGTFNEQLKQSGDYELWLRITHKFKVGNTPQLLVKNRILKDSISQNYKNQFKTGVSIKYEICKKFKVGQKIRKNCLYESYYNLVYNLVEKKEYFSAMKYWIKGFLLKPADKRNYKNLANLLSLGMTANSISKARAFLKTSRKAAKIIFIEHRLPWRVEKFLKNKRIIFPYNSIVVETSSLCNIRCVWCWMYNSKKKDLGLMDLKNFKKFVDINAKFLRKKKIKIIPFFRGEALIHPKFFDMLDYGRKKGAGFGKLDTNLSMEFDVKRLMESPIPEILVNVGGTTQEVHQKIMRGSDLELVKRNLKEMLRLNKKYNKKIGIKINPTKHNLHQLKELPKFFEEIGGNPKNAKIYTTSFPLPAEATKEEIDDFFENIVSDEMKKYLRFEYDKNRNITAKKNECSWLIPSIRWDGKVSICCHDQLGRLNLGNAFEQPIKEILKSKKYKIAEKNGREQKFNFCRNCN